METILSSIAIGIALLAFLLAHSVHKDIAVINNDLLDCSTRTRTNKLHLDTLTNKIDKPKRKAGRPRKNAPKPHKIVHQLNGN